MAERSFRSNSLAKDLIRHIVLLLLLLPVLLFIIQSGLAGQKLKIVLFCLLAALYPASLILLAIRVYRPIRKVEEAMEMLTQGDNTIFQTLELEQDSAALSLHLHELIHMLKESINREYTADILKKEAELNALQSQINPHFLYNVLDAIRGHALSEGVPEIAEMTEALSNLFRYSVSHRENEVTLERELHNIQSYFKIQQYRFNNKFDLLIRIGNDEERTRECLLPKLTLQPIIENAIYHGLEMKMGTGHVILRTKLTGSLLLIEISDDGMGMEDRDVDRMNASFRNWKVMNREGGSGSGSGIALSNVNSRIKMMYGEEYGLQIHSTKNCGLTMEILLPAGDRNG